MARNGGMTIQVRESEGLYYAIGGKTMVVQNLAEHWEGCILKHYACLPLSEHQFPSILPVSSTPHQSTDSRSPFELPNLQVESVSVDWKKIGWIL